MVAVRVITPSCGPRHWHVGLVDRLRHAGHEVYVETAKVSDPGERMLNLILALERSIPNAPRPTLPNSIDQVEPDRDSGNADLVIDLAWMTEKSTITKPVIALRFDGKSGIASAATTLCGAAVPVVDLYMDERLVDRAAPMTNSRYFIGGGLEDVLARAISILVKFVNNFDRYPEHRFEMTLAIAGKPQKELFSDRSNSAVGLATAYIFRALPRIVYRAFSRRVFGTEHWRVGYRLTDDAGVAESRSLAGRPWTILPDPGDRFYADPFPFEWQGKYFIFVEELHHTSGKGVISVSECRSNNEFDIPRTVLEEPYHLSYPQVFAHDDDVWMIPESGGGRKLSLYRASPFPDRWVEEQVLIKDCEISDATILKYDDLYWLFGTERDGAGSTADMMVVYFSKSLFGPWLPHPANPIIIDKAAARPGGACRRIADRIVIPIQDGTDCYGGGLGISEIVLLNTESVVLSRPSAIEVRGHWPYPRIHTFNRHGSLETIDGLTRITTRKRKQAKLPLDRSQHPSTDRQ